MTPRHTDEREALRRHRERQADKYNRLSIGLSMAGIAGHRPEMTPSERRRTLRHLFQAVRSL